MGQFIRTPEIAIVGDDGHWGTVIAILSRELSGVFVFWHCPGFTRVRRSPNDGIAIFAACAEQVEVAFVQKQIGPPLAYLFAYFGPGFAFVARTKYGHAVVICARSKKIIGCDIIAVGHDDDARAAQVLFCAGGAVINHDARYF